MQKVTYLLLLLLAACATSALPSSEVRGPLVDTYPAPPVKQKLLDRDEKLDTIHRELQHVQQRIKE